jgi:hypothetical protein
MLAHCKVIRNMLTLHHLDTTGIRTRYGFISTNFLMNDKRKCAFNPAHLTLVFPIRALAQQMFSEIFPQQHSRSSNLVSAVSFTGNGKELAAKLVQKQIRQTSHPDTGRTSR